MVMEMKSYDPLRIEHYVRAFWRDNDIINKCFEARKGRKLFSFLEGPPTTNGFMHVGHARGRTLKDIVIRFKLMQGFDVWRRAGWDTQGLPVELEAEKNLGLRSKKDIEAVGYEKFVKECNRLVDYYLDHWRKASELLGLWLDYDSAYQTRRKEYIEFVWWALKQAYERGLLVEDLKVIAFCPRCETPLSDQEVALGYASVEDPSIYVKIPLLDRESTYVVIWTTTPWTLPANEAVCLHPDEYYVEVEVRDERWILAEKLLEKVMAEVGVEGYKVLGKFLGSELEGAKYLHPLLDEVPEHKSHYGSHIITCDQGVSMEEGSGCVHIAPAHGPEDFEIGKKYSLPVFCPVEVNGSYSDKAGKYRGMYVRGANRVIIEDLRKKGLLAYEGTILHEYPHCWRCDTPLIYRADRQWFLRIEPIKGLILEENKKVKWIPPWAGEARFHNWIVNARDWCISRLRVWGSPLNIWTCVKSGHRVCVGSIEELKSLALTRLEDVELHRPWIDAVRLRCPNCGGEMTREPHVLDCWLDSGVAHAASVDYLKDRSLFENLFPYDFITEAVDQTRGWFFSLIFTSVMLFSKAPYKSVLCQGHVLDKLGQKMSKSKGNVVWARDVIESEGTDPLRLYLVMKAAPWESLNFDIDELKSIKRMLNIIFNVFKFASTYMELDKFDYRKYPIEMFIDKLSPEDQWILSRVQTTIEAVTSNIEAYNMHEAAKAIVNFFVEDLSHGYIRFIRRRVWLEEENVEKLMTYSVLYYVLDKALRLMAPFTPHLAEWLYQEFLKRFGGLKEESLFMLDWPSAETEFFKRELEEGASLLMEALTLVASARQKAKLKGRWPVSDVVVAVFDEGLAAKLNPFHKVLREQANARNVIIATTIPGDVKLKVRVQDDRVKKALGPKTIKLVELLDSSDAKELLRELCTHGRVSVSVDGEEVPLSNEDVEVVGIDGYEKWSFALGRCMLICLNTTRDRELEAEALTKELVRRIQYMRKELNLNIEDYIDVAVEAEGGALSILSAKNVEYLKSEVRARELRMGSKVDVVGESWYAKEWDVDGLRVKIYMRRSRG
jgi:isoleucyl-tRNA synthetase